MNQHVRNFRGRGARGDGASIATWSPWGPQPGRRTRKARPVEPLVYFGALERRLRAAGARGKDTAGRPAGGGTGS